MDTHAGRVLDLVEELGLTKDTIVIFTSDNGTTHLKLEVDYDFFESVGNLLRTQGIALRGRHKGALDRQVAGQNQSGFGYGQDDGF